MRVAVSAEGPGRQHLVEPTFGRCPWFVVVDTDHPGDRSLENPARERDSAAGVAAVQFLVDAGVDVLLTGRLGPKATRALEAAGIRAHQGCAGTVADALDAFVRPGTEGTSPEGKQGPLGEPPGPGAVSES